MLRRGGERLSSWKVMLKSSGDEDIRDGHALLFRDDLDSLLPICRVTFDKVGWGL